MWHRSRPLGRFCALGLAAGAVVLSGTAPPEHGDVTVTVTNMRSTKGVVCACMTTDAERFPRCRGDETAHRIVVPAKKVLELTFRNVKPGRYAIALLHDENENGKADRVLGMMPREGFGFSRDAKVRMGPPKFDAAAFAVGEGGIRQSIRMRYML